MDTKMEHGLSFKVINSLEEFNDECLNIRYLLGLYRMTIDDRYTIDEMLNLITLVMGHETFFMFLAKLGDRPVGLMTAHAVSVDDVKSGGAIHVGIVDSQVTRKESDLIITEAMRCLYDWAQSCGMETLFATTKRAEKPFDKLLLKHGWDRMTTVYSKPVELAKEEDNGRKHEESGTGSGNGRTFGSVPRPDATGRADQPASLGPVEAGV